MAMVDVDGAESRPEAASSLVIFSRSCRLVVIAADCRVYIHTQSVCCSYSRVVHGSISCDPTQPNTNCHWLTLSLYYSL